MTKKQLFLALFSATLFIASCQKNGELQTVLTYSQVEVSWNYNPYPTRVFSVEVDGVKVADTLMYQSPVFRYTTAVQRILGNQNPKRFILKDVATGEVVMDTMVTISGETRFRLIALSENDKPGFVNETELPTDPLTRDTTKYSFIYNDPKLPDSVILHFHLGNADYIPDYNPLPFDSVILKRNEFSRYLSFPYKDFSYPVFYFTIGDAKAQTSIQGIDGNTLTGFCYGIYLSNPAAPPIYKFSKVLIKYGGSDEPDELRRNRFYDAILSEVPW